jgi:hypothetical protein
LRGVPALCDLTGVEPSTKFSAWAQAEGLTGPTR